MSREVTVMNMKYIQKIMNGFVLIFFLLPISIFAQADVEIIPEFTLVDSQGEEVRSADLVGVPMVINLWATWCPFCVNELPDFATLQDEYGEVIKVIAINRGELSEVTREFIDSIGNSDSILFLQDSDDSYYSAIGGFAMPETLFVNSSGEIVVHKRGFMDIDEMRDITQTIITGETNGEEPSLSLLFILAAFLAGVITFLAPCTLPLVPAYLSFISGIKKEEFESVESAKQARKQIVKNSIAFVIGFSVVFVLFGLLFGLLGMKLAPYQTWLTRIGGVFVMFFGLFLLGTFNLSFLQVEKRMKIPSFLTVGKPVSSFVIGASFAFGWTPCVGPVLGSILALATVSSTAWQGAFLLAVFSLGLAVPFILTALLYSKATKYIKGISKHLKWIQRVGGMILLFIGWLLLTDNFSFLIEVGFRLLEGFSYEESLTRFL